jgi:4-amino-4-deoxy-L-arabinose transferase-like glycosyltransferase
VAIWAGIYLPTLGTLELKGEEGRRILPGQTMLRTGDWIVPQVGGEDYLRKPPMINWLAAASFRLTGVENEWTARLPSVLGVLIIALVIFLAGVSWLGHPAAFAAAIFTITNIGMMEKGRLLEIDALYSAFTGVAIVAWLRGWMLGRPWLTWLAAGVALGLGYLLKGPVHLLFFYAVVVAVLWKAGELRKMLHPAHLLGVLVAVGLVALWWVPFQARTGGAGGAMIYQLTDRLDGSDFDLSGWLLNIPRGLSNFLPWCLFLLVAWVPLHPDAPHKLRALIAGLRWAIIASFVAVSLAPGSLPRYTMPVTVPFALLIALVLTWGTVPDRLWKIWRTVTGGGVGGLKVLAQRSGFLLVILIAIYSLAIVPQLKKRSLWRAAAEKINAAIPAGETLYAVDPGSQPIFFYLTAPYRFIDKVSQLPQEARYILARGKPIADLRKHHPEARELISYEDRGEKITVLLQVDAPR